MDDTAVRQARRQVAWLMVPVAVIAVLIPLLSLIALSVLTSSAP